MLRLRYKHSRAHPSLHYSLRTKSANFKPKVTTFYWSTCSLLAAKLICRACRDRLEPQFRRGCRQWWSHWTRLQGRSRWTCHGWSCRTHHCRSRRTSGPNWSQHRPVTTILLPGCSTNSSKRMEQLVDSAPARCRHSTRLSRRLCAGCAVVW